MSGTFKLPNLGGTPVRTSINNPISYVSPDNKWTSYFEIGKGIVRLSLEKENDTRPVTVTPLPDFHYQQIGPWSSDGKLISFYGSPAGGGPISVAVVDINDGLERLVSEPIFSMVTGIAWLPNSSGLIVAGKLQSSDISQVWLINYPDGKIRQITRDTSNYFWPTVSEDGRSLTAIKRERPSQIWSLSYDASSVGSAVKKDASPVTRLISQTMVEGYYGVAAATADRIIFTSSESDNIDIWSMRFDGSDRKQLTRDPAIDVHPTVCGREGFIVFRSFRSGTYHLWRMNPDGSSQIKLTEEPGAQSPGCDPTGRWVYFSIQDRFTRRSTVWKVSIDGGKASQVTSFESMYPRVSPDGKYLSVYGAGEMKFLDLQTGRILNTFRLHPNMEWEFANNLKWSPDGRGVVFVASKNGVSNLYLQPMDGEAVRLTDFTSLGIWHFDWSYDGKELFLSRGSVTSDIVLIRDRR